MADELATDFHAIKLTDNMQVPGVDKITAIPANVTKEWHQSMHQDIRSQFLHNIVQAIIQHPQAPNMQKPKTQGVIAALRKLEYNTYLTSNSGPEYCGRLAKTKRNLMTQLEEKRKLRTFCQQLQQLGSKSTGSHDTPDTTNLANHLYELKRTSGISGTQPQKLRVNSRNGKTGVILIKVGRLNSPITHRCKLTVPQMMEMLTSSKFKLLELQKQRLLQKLKMNSHVMASFKRHDKVKAEAIFAQILEQAAADKLQNGVVTSQQKAPSDFQSDLEYVQDMLNDLNIITE